jgi:hypothetical protein
MAKKTEKSQIEAEAGSMEMYVHRLILTCDEKLNDPDNPPTFETFLYYTGAKNFLYMILTGHNNASANPKPKPRKDHFSKYKDSPFFTGKRPNEKQ